MRAPDFDIDLSRGARSESELRSLLLQEGYRVEVKTDFRAAATGNVYIEYECKRKGNWVPSGILESKAEWYALRLANGWMLIPKADLYKAIFDDGLGGQRQERDGSHPTRGFVIPVDALAALIAGRKKASAA
jgi:hypothetical protein